MSFSFSERNPLVLGSITIGLIAAAVVGVLVLNADAFADRYTVNARFEDAAGIRFARVQHTHRALAEERVPGGVIVAELEAGQVAGDEPAKEAQRDQWGALDPRR